MWELCEVRGPMPEPLYPPHHGRGPTGSREQRAGTPRGAGADRGVHQTQLRALLERVRAGFVELDHGGMDEFELHSLIHHYQRSATELWKFCRSTGGQWLHAARALRYFREQSDDPDWWEAGRSRRDRSP
jgi:hypothetical protein